LVLQQSQDLRPTLNDILELFQVGSTNRIQSWEALHPLSKKQFDRFCTALGFSNSQVSIIFHVEPGGTPQLLMLSMPTSWLDPARAQSSVSESPAFKHSRTMSHHQTTQVLIFECHRIIIN